MSLLIQKHKELETALGQYLDEVTKNPPLGFSGFLKPINQSFQLCRIQGHLIQTHENKIAELQQQLAELLPQEAANDE
ncbi:hypothetical protein L9W97_01905 [Vibrio aestuarianus]|uniref:hypothetical protein n=1 Tax=Vibrio aestuarianus TaxID=28171 RepID=UPI00237CD2D2|nr:hypothetical protein [Vibrio aestuarianus]MDE1323874.1 hypothetical protein [Vibrio aestuarianus]